MISFRTKKCLKKYSQKLQKNIEGCPICEREGINNFKYWKIIKNNFPYDKIAKEHNMLVPVRHVVERGLNQEETNELKNIKNGFIKDSDYDYIMETTERTKSIPVHFHLHLIKLK